MNKKHDNTDICRQKLAEKGISFETPEEEDLFVRVITNALETRIALCRAARSNDRCLVAVDVDGL